MYERAKIIEDVEAVVGVILDAWTREQAGETVPQRQTVEGFEVGVTSLRLRTFASHPLCCANPDCGLVPEFFAIERHAGKKGARVDAPYHLNLYGRDEDGREVLFTHDHLLARSLGGTDELSNTATLCTNCNGQKAVHEQIELYARRLLSHPDTKPKAKWVSKASQRLLASHQRMLRHLAKQRGQSMDAVRDWCLREGQEQVYAQPARAMLLRMGLRRVAQAMGLDLPGLVALRQHGGGIAPDPGPEVVVPLKVSRRPG